MIDSDSNIQVSTTELPDEEPQVVEVEEEMVPDLVQSARIENLEEAKKLLYSGNIDQSINIYNNFIKEGHHLDDVIQDIQSALDHQFPIDINLWQALGDAYLKDKQLQNALDAYSKAEDLLS
jgi:tetratricopeptide (TPR) repeat protein